MFEKESEEYATKHTYNGDKYTTFEWWYRRNSFQEGAETTLRKVIKYFSTRVLDENCGGYFSKLLENEEKLQELAKELENV